MFIKEIVVYCKTLSKAPLKVYANSWTVLIQTQKRKDIIKWAFV